MTDVDVVGYRDPDGDVSMTVFVDGCQDDEAAVTIVDPGRGGLTVSELRRRQRAATRRHDDVGDYLWGLYEDAKSSEFVRDDVRVTSAVNANPYAVTIGQTDPDDWIQHGLVSVERFPHDVFANNTVRAGYALGALRRFAVRQEVDGRGSASDVEGEALIRGGLPPEADLAVCDGVRRYAATTRSVPGGLGELLVGLLGGLWHLADAWNMDLDMPRSWSVPELGGWLPPFYTAVRQLSRQAVRAGRIDQDFVELEGEALDRYHRQLTGVDVGVE